jgi:hypothetical protein
MPVMLGRRWLVLVGIGWSALLIAGALAHVLVFRCWACEGGALASPHRSLLFVTVTSLAVVTFQRSRGKLNGGRASSPSSTALLAVQIPAFVVLEWVEHGASVAGILSNSVVLVGTIMQFVLAVVTARTVPAVVGALRTRPRVTQRSTSDRAPVVDVDTESNRAGARTSARRRAPPPLLLPA